MTEPERAALEHIRQVVDSVIGVPAPPEPAPPEPVLVEKLAAILPVPYFSQLAGEVDQSFNDSGTTAGVMLVRAYIDQSSTPTNFYHQAGQGSDNPLSFTQILNAMNANGVPVELRSNLKMADLSLILFSGRPVIAPIRQDLLHLAGLAPERFDGPYFVVVVGMDVKDVTIHDPVRKDSSGEAQGIPWLTFYQAWTNAQGYERAVLVPRQQLVRRVRVKVTLLDVHALPSAESSVTGTVSLGELFEIKTQKSGWGKIGEDGWISLSSTADI